MGKGTRTAVVWLAACSIAGVAAWAQDTGPAPADTPEPRTDQDAPLDQNDLIDQRALTDKGNPDLLGILDVSRWTPRDTNLYWDNDGTLPNIIDDTDEYYTNGNGVRVSFDPNPSPALAARLAPSGSWDDPRFGVAIGLSQRIYTPVDLTLADPPPNDHPYGGYLYASLELQRADDDTHDHLGLDIGIVGESSFAEDTQKWIHEEFPREIVPRGWGTQLPDEVAFNITLARTWKTERADIMGLGLEMLPRVRLDAGTVLIRAAVETTARIGLALPEDFGPATLLGITDHTAGLRDDHQLSVYLYGTLAAELVLHDIFIDGTVFQSSRSTNREELVHRFRFGLIAQWHGLYIGWSQTFESDRFESQGGTHAFGSIVLGFSVEF